MGFAAYSKGKDLFSWWGDYHEEHKELALFAQFLLDAAVQLASVERLFKDYSRFHTQVRNWLSTQKMHEQQLLSII